MWNRTQMAARVAQDIPEGWFVNLGIGIPTMVADHVPEDREVILHSENGILGMGPAPTPDKVNVWLENAGKQHVTLRRGGSFFHHADSFAMIRGGHIDLCVLGAFEVAETGDLANWATSDNEAAPAVGGAMDLAAGAKRVWVVSEHTTKDGTPKLVERCAYPLPRARWCSGSIPTSRWWTWSPAAASWCGRSCRGCRWRMSRRRPPRRCTPMLDSRPQTPGARRRALRVAPLDAARRRALRLPEARQAAP